MYEINLYKLAGVLAFLDSDNNNLLIHVPGAIIEGKYGSNQSREDSIKELENVVGKTNLNNQNAIDIAEKDAMTYDRFYNITKDLKEDYEIKKDLSGQGIRLHDVTITISGQDQIINLPTYFLFLDQVIGISYGS